METLKEGGPFQHKQYFVVMMVVVTMTKVLFVAGITKWVGLVIKVMVAMAVAVVILLHAMKAQVLVEKCTDNRTGYNGSSSGSGGELYSNGRDRSCNDHGIDGCSNGCGSGSSITKCR